MSHLKLRSDDVGQDAGHDEGYVVYCWTQEEGWSVVTTKDETRVDPRHLTQFVKQLSEEGRLVVVLPRNGTLPEDWEGWHPLEARPPSLKVFSGC